MNSARSKSSRERSFIRAARYRSKLQKDFLKHKKELEQVKRSLHKYASIHPIDKILYALYGEQRVNKEYCEIEEQFSKDSLLTFEFLADRKLSQLDLR